MLTRPGALGAGRFALGLLCLVLCLVAAGVLAGQHLHLFAAPGCGGGGACDRAAASAWGRLPLVGWPLSCFGLAWFAALLAGWITAYRDAGVSSAFRALVLLGAAGSTVYVVAMLAGGFPCPYCMAVHAGNLVFLLVVLQAPRASDRPLARLGPAATAFAAVTLGLVGADAWAQGRLEAERLASTRQIIASATPSPSDRPAEGHAAFEGRHRRGPEVSPIRIVTFLDYACGFCRQVEEQVETLRLEYDFVSASIKHYPLCRDCNEQQDTTLAGHENACRAALAAETAGLLGGEPGFQAMHGWLFDRKGNFDEDELRAQVLEMGLDPDAFATTLASEEPLALVHADVDEARQLGVYATPVVYINGHELGGVTGHEALLRAVREMVSAGLTPGDASTDRPRPAREKYIADWRANPQLSFHSRPDAWFLGPTDAAVEIVLFGDYATKETAAAHRRVQPLVERRGDVRYVFRHFPISVGCNPIAQRTLDPRSCLAHRAAQAAGALGGGEAFWRMHTWLLDRLPDSDAPLDSAVLVDAAVTQGLEAEAFQAVLDDPATTSAIAADCREAARTGLTFVPALTVHGRKVPAWNQPDILDVLVEAALREPRPGAHRIPPVDVLGTAVGPVDAPVHVVLHGDLTDSDTTLADRLIQEHFARRTDVRYEFRSLLRSGACPPDTPVWSTGEACRAHRALHAAHLQGGLVAYWRMHAVLLGNREPLVPSRLAELGRSARLDPAALLAALDDPDVTAALVRDAGDAEELGLEQGPAVSINGRLLVEWRSRERLGRARDEAAQQAGRPPPARHGGGLDASGPAGHAHSHHGRSRTER